LKYEGVSTPNGVLDALPDGEQWSLIASADGMMRLHIADGRIQRIATPDSSDQVQSLCRDGEGRLWAVGDGLSVSSDEGLHWRNVLLPMLGKTFLKRLRISSSNPKQMLLSLYDRGVVVLDF
jgi:hypothetical protein